MARLYLDDNATTKLDPRVRAAMEPLLGGAPGQSVEPARGGAAGAGGD